MFPCISVLLWTPLPSFCLRASSDSKEIPPPPGTTNAPSHPAVDNTMNLPFPWVMLATHPGSTGIQPSRATVTLYAGGSVGDSRQMYCAHSLCSPRRSIASLDHHQDTSPEVKLQRISRQQRQSLKALGAGPDCHHPPLASCHLWDLLSSTSIPCSLTLQALELFLFVKKCQVTPCLHFLSFAVFSAWKPFPMKFTHCPPQQSSSNSRVSCPGSPWGPVQGSWTSPSECTLGNSTRSIHQLQLALLHENKLLMTQPWSYVTEMALGMCQKGTPTFGMTPKPRVFCVQNSRNNVALEEAKFSAIRNTQVPEAQIAWWTHS